MTQSATGTPESPAPFDFDQIDFVTSDHHFGHARIIELAERPFTSLGAMHGALIAAWNRVVGPEDVVLHLGDLALGNREESIAITAALKGKKYLLPGNHDTISTVYKCSEAHRQQTRDLLDQYGWEVLPENLIGRRGERTLLASHYPYRGDSQSEERHSEARPIDTGLPLIHGHTHATDHGPHGRMFHVGVDGTDFTPVAMSTIDGWLEGL